MHKYLFYILLFVAWAAVAPPARAQFICSVTEGPHIGTNVYFGYEGLSCNGNTCMVSAKTLPDTGYGFGQIAFLRSVDGGHTWSVQHPRPSDTAGSGITGIDQIDSLNIVAYGASDTGATPFALLLRTSNAGATWQQETVPTKYQINDISFSNGMDGILVAGDGTFVTSDGGDHWDSVSYPREQCHAYGNGMYRVFDRYTEKIYTTTDGWNSFDSSMPIVSDSIQRTYYFYDYCSFGSGNTILAFGFHSQTPCIARTTDGGHHWSSVFDDSTGLTGYVASLSDVNRDTILADVSGYRNEALWSTDNGATWEIDSLICSDTNLYQCGGIGLNSGGELVGAFNHFVSGQPAMNSLIIGRHVTSSVISNNFGNTKVQLFPNPATNSITLIGAMAGRTMHLLDILGREVLSGRVPASGTLTLDISSLPPGLYYLNDGTTNTKFVKE